MKDSSSTDQGKNDISTLSKKGKKKKKTLSETKHSIRDTGEVGTWIVAVQRASRGNSCLITNDEHN